MIIAQRLISVNHHGTKKPMFMDCLDENGVTTERLVKDARLGHINSRHLAAEVTSAKLVQGLGLVVADHQVVVFDGNHLAGINATLKAQGHKELATPGFGVGALNQRGFQPIESAATYDAALRADASILYVFDLISMHYDRRRDNPNCGVLGQQLFVYDFDQCFAHITEPSALDATRRPFEIANADWKHGHLFLEWLRAVGLDEGAVRSAFANRTEPWWAANRPTVPKAWDTIVDEIWDQARQIAPNLDKLLEEANNSLR